jgi:hypothetical protein
VERHPKLWIVALSERSRAAEQEQQLEEPEQGFVSREMVVEREERWRISKSNKKFEFNLEA